MNKKKVCELLFLVAKVITGLFLLFVVIFFAISPGKIDAIQDKKGKELVNSISEIRRQKIGGIQQGMIIRGNDINKPVLLFLHGGPGSPEYTLIKDSSLKLEELFTVCYWEQRGAGMSYSYADSETMTVDQMISDTVEVTNYLRERFNQDKIFVLGHSWGTFLGMQVVQQHPELYQAYIGTGQLKNAIEGEKQVIEAMVKRAQDLGKEDLVRQLEECSVSKENKVDNDYFMLKAKARDELRMTPDQVPDSGVKKALLEVLTCKEYTVKDKINYFRGLLPSGKAKKLFEAFTTRDLSAEVSKVDVPIYFLQGKYDDQTPYVLAEKYFDILEAPYKKFYTFNSSAHSPMIEESEKFRRILKEIIQKETVCN